MARQPGKQSSLAFLYYLSLVLGKAGLLIGGHALMAYLLASAAGIVSGGMDEVVKLSGIPVWLLVLTMIATLLLDGMMIYHSRQERKRALAR